MLRIFILICVSVMAFINPINSEPNSIVLIADPRVLAIPINENKEELIDLKHQTLLAFGPSPEIPNNTDYTKVRRSVYEKLLLAQSLLPPGLKLCLYEGYRSTNLQKKLFDEHYQRMHSMHIDWTHEKVFKETTKMVSPVINIDGSTNVPPHCTGAAVDVYLIDDKGNAVDMGIHPKDAAKDKDGSLSQTDSTKISSKAMKNRAIMNSVLLKAGFINYPTEYWHWSYGDRYWAYTTGHAAAIYDMIK